MSTAWYCTPMPLANLDSCLQAGCWDTRHSKPEPWANHGRPWASTHSEVLNLLIYTSASNGVHAHSITDVLLVGPMGRVGVSGATGPAIVPVNCRPDCWLSCHLIEHSWAFQLKLQSIYVPLPILVTYRYPPHLLQDSILRTGVSLTKSSLDRSTDCLLCDRHVRKLRTCISKRQSLAWTSLAATTNHTKKKKKSITTSK